MNAGDTHTMKDIFLLVIAVGLAGTILFFANLHKKTQGINMIRPLFGGALILGSIFLWWGSAILLTHWKMYYLFVDFMVIALPFIGLAQFFPLPPGATDLNRVSKPSAFIIAIGFLLGGAHVWEMMFNPQWPHRLIEFYQNLGI